MATVCVRHKSTLPFPPKEEEEFTDEPNPELFDDWGNAHAWTSHNNAIRTRTEDYRLHLAGAIRTGTLTLRPPDFSASSRFRKVNASSEYDACVRAGFLQCEHKFLPAEPAPFVTLGTIDMSSMLLTPGMAYGDILVTTEASVRDLFEQRVISIFQRTSYLQDQPKLHNLLGAFLYAYPSNTDGAYFGLALNRLASQALVPSSLGAKAPSLSLALSPFLARASEMGRLVRDILMISSQLPGHQHYGLLERLGEIGHWAIGFRGDGFEGLEHTLKTGKFEGATRVKAFGGGCYFDLAPQDVNDYSALQYALKYATMARNLPKQWQDYFKSRLHSNQDFRVGFLQFGLVFLGPSPGIAAPKCKPTDLDFGPSWAYTSTVVPDLTWLITQQELALPLGVLALQ